jgi:predicted PurR-regulated permease PerM
MDLSERIGWLLLGMAVGFVLGYIVRSLREIRDELNKVDTIINKQKEKDEKGVSSSTVITHIMLVVVLALSVWASFETQQTSNQVQNSTGCNVQFLRKTIRALNERTTYVESHRSANIELQKAQAVYLNTVLQKPPPPRSVLVNSLETYFAALRKFVRVSQRTTRNAQEFPFPTSQRLTNCLDRE